MNAGRFQLLVLKRRHAEDAGDVARTAEQGHRCIRWRHANRDWVELGEVGPAPRLGRCHLQNDGLDRNLDGGQRDLVLMGEIRDAPDIGIARIEQDGLRGEGGNALDGVRRALRARPDRKQARHATRHDVDRSRQQGIVHGRRAVEGGPHHLHFRDARRLGVLLNEVLPLHQVELQIAHRELASEAYLRHLSGRRCDRRQQCARGTR